MDVDAVLSFPIVYASARAGRASLSRPADGTLPDGLDLGPLMRTILEAVPAPSYTPDAPLQAQVTNLDASPFLGRLALCRVHEGTIRRGQQVAWCRRDSTVELVKVTELMITEALERVPAEEAGPGDIIAVAGIPDIMIGETLADPDDPRPLPLITVDEPAISMTIGTNTSPLAVRQLDITAPQNLRFFRALVVAPTQTSPMLSSASYAAGQFHFTLTGTAGLSYIIQSSTNLQTWANAGKAQWEYEVDAEVAYVFKLRNADNWGYPDIVGCGPNATTLHYEESQGPVKTGQLMLMDVGAEYDHYSADVTRTFPVNGKFSKEQAEIYQIVYDAQEAVAKVSRPGGSLSDINGAATEVIKDGLLKLGLITDRNSDSQYRIWFMHGTGHWLGMNVHDVGGGARFEPGMTFTNEPGIYIRPDALDNLASTPENAKFIAAIKPAFEKYKGIGVRIEDDMLITPEGVKWMTAALPRSIADIEAFIAKARR
jgi:hypothetical protein